MDTQKLLDTIGTVLAVMKAVANTQGVNLLPYAAVASSAISAIQVAFGLGRDIMPYVDALKSTFGDGSKIPTEAEIADLDQKIKELENIVQAPLPPAEEGEPD